MFISILISTLQLLGLYKDMHPNTNPWLLAGLDRFKPQNRKALEWSPQHGHQNLPLSSRNSVIRVCVFCWAKHPHELWNLLGVSKIWTESTCPWIKPWFWQSKKDNLVYPYPKKSRKIQGQLAEIESTLKITQFQNDKKKEVRWVGITTAMCSKLSTANIAFCLHVWFQ